MRTRSMRTRSMRTRSMRTRSMRTRLLVLVGMTAAVMLLAVGPAAAHVTVNPREAPKGGRAEFSFRVPNERDNASTTKLEVTFPTDTPIPSARILPVAGWTAKVERAKLAQPVKSGDDEITEAISKITWTGGKIDPDQYMNFTVNAGPLPDNADQLVFKAVQTYSNGEVVNWIQEAAEGAEEPEHPAPVLKLIAAPAGENDHGGAANAAGGGNGQEAAAAAMPADVATQAEVDSARRTATLGVGAGVVGLLVGAVALVAATRRRGTTT
jgi:uncharacterized protein YcnI